MDVPASTLRAELSSWVERVRGGAEVVVTERGAPVARLVAVSSALLLEDLLERGVIGKPSAPRPTARGSTRVRASGPVADLVDEQRR